jgi:hypothetical protein
MTWKVLPHRPIEKLSEDLWRVEGDLPRGPMPRAMTLVRLPDRRIVIYSAIALDATAMAAIEAWGTPAVLIVPNDRHRIDPAAYRERYGGLRVIAPAGARARIEKAVAVDATEIDLGPTVAVRPAGGTRDGELWLEVHEGERTTVVLGDFIMNLRPLRGFGGWIMNRMGFTGDAPKVTKPTQTVLVKDPAAAASQLEVMAALPGLHRVLVCHGAPITDNPAAALRAAAAKLGARS